MTKEHQDAIDEEARIVALEEAMAGEQRDHPAYAGDSEALCQRRRADRLEIQLARAKLQYVKFEAVARAELDRRTKERDDWQARHQQVVAEVAVLRGVDCTANGDGPCGCCIKCYQERIAKLETALRRMLADYGPMSDPISRNEVGNLARGVLGLQLRPIEIPMPNPLAAAENGRIATLTAERDALAAERDEALADLYATGWKPIETLDRTQMQLVLVYEDGAQRLFLWNPNGYWEYPVSAPDICGSPTHWTELPEPPK